MNENESTRDEREATLFAINWNESKLIQRNRNESTLIKMNQHE